MPPSRAERALCVVLAAALGAPMLAAAGLALRSGLDLQAWRDLLAAPQVFQALALSLWSGLASTLLSIGLCALILSLCFPRRWPAVVRLLGPMLAVPHAAFAIGLALLISPSGWLLRLVSPWATGFEQPPPWATTQDPWGLGLIAVLVAKEVPFLLWASAACLQRSDVARLLARERALALTLGYTPRAAWWRVIWPQLWPRLAWPMLAVLAYSMTVVDVALVIGPTSPPTLGVQAWVWLRDPDPALNRQGAAAAWLSAFAVAAIALLLWWCARRRWWRSRWTDGARDTQSAADIAAAGSAVAAAVPPALQPLLAPYLPVLLALAWGSVAGVWPFPDLLPQAFTLQAWASVARSTDTLGTTLTLGLASAAAALLWSLAWLECAPRHWDRALRQLIHLPLALPAVLWVVGVHALTVTWQVDTRWSGLWLAHSLACTPYVLITLGPAYAGFDPRLRQVAASLGQRRASFLLRVKWPLLRAALWAAFAVGFAVSVAQYLPTLFIGAGRFSTVTTEAVTLAAAGQRSMTSAYAWLQWCLPLLVFALAAWAGQPRRFRR